MTEAPVDFSTLTGTYTIDPAHSRFGFVARHAMITKVRGQFDEFTGSTTIDGADPSNSSVSLTLQVASIDTRNAQRDGHLRTNDFFDAEQYPEITFVSTAIDNTSDADFAVTGDLTIKGSSKSVSFPLEFTGQATDPFGNVRIGFDGSVQVNRSEYGLTWNVPLDAGGVLVGERVTLEFEISAIKDA